MGFLKKWFGPGRGKERDFSPGEHDEDVVDPAFPLLVEAFGVEEALGAFGVNRKTFDASLRIWEAEKAGREPNPEDIKLLRDAGWEI